MSWCKKARSDLIEDSVIIVWCNHLKWNFLLCFRLIISLNLFSPLSSYGKENATWIKSTYFRGHDPISKKGYTTKDIEDFALRLKTNQIRYAYIFAGPYGNDGHLPDYAFSQKAKESIAVFKRIYPEIKILPWIGGVQNKTVHLERAEWIKNAIADTTKLMRVMPVEVHLDVEYALYPDNRFNYKKLNANDYSEQWIKFHNSHSMLKP